MRGDPLPDTVKRKHGNLEIYDNVRFLTVTGHLSANATAMPEIANHQPLIDSFMRLMPPRAAPLGKTVSADTAPDEVVQKVLQAAQGEPLWDGVWDYGDNLLGTPYPSQSEADFALLGAIVRQAAADGIAESMVADVAFRVFEQSGLYRPEKRQRVLTQDIPKHC